ncbi:hypothetical protein FB33_1647 [Cutibacterium acnes]|jgi:hypothetical protein|nr:hypothetical protein FB33_1647 [Cutibacterium acnes]
MRGLVIVISPLSWFLVLGLPTEQPLLPGRQPRHLQRRVTGSIWFQLNVPRLAQQVANLIVET